MAVGGDILEVTYNHPTLGTGIFRPKSNEDNTYDQGGIRTNDDSNMVDGGGTAINQKNRVRGFFEVVISNDINTNEELDQVNALAADPVEADWTFSLINGAVFGGAGTPVGDIQGNVNQATFTLKVSGSQFKKIVG